MTSKTHKKPVVRRLSPEEREQQIVAKAISYFATRGFTGSTRELAKEIGVTQPLLYRYFPSKDALVDRVFQVIYLSRWNAEWDDLLRDRSRPLAKRLQLFYKQYSAMILQSDWIRIFIFAGLTRQGINDRYLAGLRAKVFDVVLAELRFAHGLDDPTPRQYEDEIEFVWGLHAAIFYIGVRKWVYGLSVRDDLDRLVGQKVEVFLASAPKALKNFRKIT